METSTAQENGTNAPRSGEKHGLPPRSQVRAAGKSTSSRKKKKKSQSHPNPISESTSEVPAIPELPLGPVLSTIKRSDLSEYEFPAYQAKVTHVKYVASYSWSKEQESTIVVPG